MAIIPPEFESLADAIPSAEFEDLGPAENPSFEIELVRFERRLRYEREQSFLGVHPDGLGPTLGQDLAKPNTGADLDWEHQGYKPPS
jgi:hypothetical protein